MFSLEKTNNGRY